MVDIDFLLTLGIIFLVALIGSYLRASRLDRCLRDFRGFHVTVEKIKGRIIWGNMKLESSGLELEYKTNVQDQAHIETSYLLYREEFEDIQAVYRYADELSGKNQWKRERALRQSFHPKPWRIFTRKLRNFASTANDSLTEALGVVTGRARKPARSHLTETGEAYLQKLGKDLIGHVGTTFDPLLENYVGAKVVVEVLEEDMIHEYVGILKEYSAHFLELLDVLYPKTLSVNLRAEKQRKKIAEGIEINFDGVFKIKNTGDYPLLLHKVKAGEREGEMNAVIGPGDQAKLQALNLTDIRTNNGEDIRVFFEGLSTDEEAALEAAERLREAAAKKAKENPNSNGEEETQVYELSAKELAAQNIQFDFKIIRLLDMIVPRERALIRHKAERYAPDQAFGELTFALPFGDKEKSQEELYREAVEHDPTDTNSAIALAQLLLREAKYEEAIFYLEKALKYRDKLIDHGRLASLQLKLAKKKLSSRNDA
jgi:hypothetical protein